VSGIGIGCGGRLGGRVEAENGSKSVEVESSFGFVVTIGVRSNDYCFLLVPCGLRSLLLASCLFEQPTLLFLKLWVTRNVGGVLGFN
jgi:hypothetical protein